MKLWLKISLISIIMVMAATCVCNLVLLIRSGNSNLELAVNNTLSTLDIRAGSWRVTMDARMQRDMDEVSERSLAQFLLRNIADGKTVLLRGGETIYNATGILPAEHLPVGSGETKYVITDIDGYSILIAGKSISVGSGSYTMYQMDDLTSVFGDIRETASQFALVGLVIVGIVGIVTVLLVRRLLRPVEELRSNAASIADGVYGRRIAITEQDEIGELAGDFNRMAEAVQQHIQTLHTEAERRTLLMSALAHELKTPITSISGNAQTLLLTKLSEEEQQKSLRMIDAECTRVERLSQKLMQLIVLRQTEDITMQKQDMDGFLNGISASCGPALDADGVRLAVDNHMDTLDMDADLLGSLLLNLIDNARKASGKGDTVTVIAKDNSITVADTGTGIPPEALAQITQPFYMADKSRARKAGGMGLGLALAEEIAKLHNARMVIESAQGQGTAVKVVFDNEA